MNNTYTELIQIASRAAHAAGKIMRDGWGKAHAIEFKGAINLVTEVDRAAEKIILEQLRAATPDFDVLTEESGAIPPRARGGGANYRWVIDPLDGTTNYAHHFPYFTTSIGLEENGASVAGVVYDPLLDQLFSATRGGGAFLNTVPIQCSDAQAIDQSVIATGLMYDIWESERGIPEIVRLFKHARSVRINGSAALDFCYVACGRLDAYCDTGLSPWDVSAARLILAEAGGTFQLYGNAALFEEQYCIASNGKIHAALEALLLADSR
jgi:myo-inositol-1(or 4)-monophosphatase